MQLVTSVARRRSRSGLRGIRIRAVRREDRERIAQAFLKLDPDSVFQRFFVAKKWLSDEELRRLTDSDGVHDVVLVATAVVKGQEVIVGLGRYAQVDANAEVAFTVLKEYRGRGIASEMLRQLTAIARRHGIPKFEAYVLRGNAPMRAVFERSGLPMDETEERGIVHVTLDLDAAPGVV